MTLKNIKLRTSMATNTFPIIGEIPVMACKLFEPTLNIAKIKAIGITANGFNRATRATPIPR